MSLSDYDVLLLLRLDTGIIARRLGVQFDYFEDHFDEGLAASLVSDDGIDVIAHYRINMTHGAVAFFVPTGQGSEHLVDELLAKLRVGRHLIVAPRDLE